MHIENQLKQLILSKYSSLKAFSDYVGISNSTVDSIIKRGVKNANIANVITICRALNIDVDELANGNIVSKNISSPIAPREISLISNYRQLNDDGQDKVDEYTIDLVDSGKYATEAQPAVNIRYTEMPVYNEPAAAGIGNYLQDSTYEMISFPIADIPTGVEFGIRISGKSMEPEIMDGSIVWVKPQVSLEDGEIGIFVLNGDAFCKKLHIDYDNNVVKLLSINPEYIPITVVKSDNLRTVGKVMGICDNSSTL